MKITIKREAKIGLLVLLTLAGGVWGFNYLKGKDIFKKKREYYAIYNHVQGLGESSPVMVNGLTVGSVSSVELIPERPGFMLVAFRITDKNFRFPKDSKAKIESPLLLGSTFINMELGKSTVLAEPGDTVIAANSDGIMDVINPIKSRVEGLIATIDSVLKPIQYVLDENTVKSLSVSIQGIPQIIANLQGASGNLNNLLSPDKGKLAEILSNVESITGNLKENNDNISLILQNVEEITDSLAKSNFKNAITSATDAIKKVDEIVAKINNGEGTLGALINDERLFLQLDSAASNLNFLISDIGENPDRYLNFSLIHINKKSAAERKKKKQKKSADSK